MKKELFFALMIAWPALNIYIADVPADAVIYLFNDSMYTKE